MSKHTKTPWTHIEFAGMHILLDANSMPISEHGVENYQRIVACVNACEGLENEQLKNLAKKVNTLVMNYDNLTAQRDQLVAKLEQSHQDNQVLTDLLLRIAQRLDASNIEILQDINDTLEGLKK